MLLVPREKSTRRPPPPVRSWRTTTCFCSDVLLSRLFGPQQEKLNITEIAMPAASAAPAAAAGGAAAAEAAEPEVRLSIGLPVLALLSVSPSFALCFCELTITCPSSVRPEGEDHLCRQAREVRPGVQGQGHSGGQGRRAEHEPRRGAFPPFPRSFRRCEAIGAGCWLLGRAWNSIANGLT